ncbi:MAG TPA: methionyl-tRNA formyltransferase [Candidatus Acidoferrum sp.]|nr:methionyl-tRNA formyltransferase [Candidatus Acidoferrum sp.]
MAALRIVFMGTAELSCASLQALVASPEFQVVGVVTQPDRPKGRDLKLRPTPVKELALREKLPVLQPEKARDEAFVAQLRALEPDLVAVAAYGQILPKSLLDLPRFGCLNVHTSLLPKYRGPAPIQWAILNGDAETGVTIMKIAPALDTGDILAQASTPIRPDDNSATLHDRLARIGAELLVRTIPGVVSGKLVSSPQPAEGVSYAPKITKQDGRIDWQQPARVVWNRVRGLVPWPGAYTFLPASPQPQLLKIWQAEVAQLHGQPGQVLQADKAGVIVGCGADALRILALQREGGRRLTASEFLAGHPLKPGLHLG